MFYICRVYNSKKMLGLIPDLVFLKIFTVLVGDTSSTPTKAFVNFNRLFYLKIH